MVLLKSTYSHPYTLKNLILQNVINLQDNKGLILENDDDVIESVAIDFKYAGYIKKENELIKRTEKFEKMKIPNNIDYKEVGSLSNETMERLKTVRSETIGQLQRVKGVKPTDINHILIFLTKKRD